jgi:hypothetical protein
MVILCDHSGARWEVGQCVKESAQDSQTAETTRSLTQSILLGLLPVGQLRCVAARSEVILTI